MPKRHNPAFKCVDLAAYSGEISKDASIDSWTFSASNSESASSHWDGDNGGRVFCAETRGGGGVAHGDEFAGEGEVDGDGGEGAGCGGDD